MFDTFSTFNFDSLTITQEVVSSSSFSSSSYKEAHEEGESGDKNETLDFVNLSFIGDDFVALEDEENVEDPETEIEDHPVSMEERLEAKVEIPDSCKFICNATP
ncbi:hypothetical protein RJT34_09147 [Clitoria ternatea]|uniref:Uncharacterized protein n=1 Tax=Clitoria ternatea TaxID=43366 RepID=A0AAN9PV91_CLITE